MTERDLAKDIQQLHVVDSHTCGQPTRVIQSGAGLRPGMTPAEGREMLRETADWVRRIAVFEPRGHRSVFGAALIPPAAPHPTRMRRRLPDILNSCPMAEPMAEPICTIGPSRPAEPPEPMQMADAIALAVATLLLMRPSRIATAAMTSGTPCPFAS